MTREQFIGQVESTQGAFRRFLVALCCGDAALADDIAQEAYIKAYLSIDTLASADKFAAWLYRIGCNAFLNHRRSARTYSDYEDMEADDTADSAFRYQELYAALAQLPDRERTSTLLYYLQGYSVKEIAEIVGVKPDAVKQHLSRGRARLRNILGENDGR